MSSFICPGISIHVKHHFNMELNFGLTVGFLFMYLAAMDMKAVKEVIAEEEDDDVPGKRLDIPAVPHA